MQKLSVEVLERMMSARLTNKETDLILLVARYQDDYGTIQGVYYRSVCEKLNISCQGYYNALRSLEKKGIISCTKRSYTDWDVTINGNSFAGKENYGRGYISLGHGMPRSAEFAKLKGGAKLMALYLLREWLICRKHSKSSSYRIGKDTLYEKFKFMGVKKRTIRAYLKELSPFLSVHPEGGLYYLTFTKAAAGKPDTGESGNDELRTHLARTACRRNRIRENAEQAVKGIAGLLSQYHPFEDIRHGAYDVTLLLKESLKALNPGVADEYRWKRAYSPALVHKLLREGLGLESPSPGAAF